MFGYQQMFDMAPVAMCVYTVDGLIVAVNPAFCRILGCQESDILNVPLQHFVATDQRLAERIPVRQTVLEDIAPEEHELALRHKHGHTIWLVEYRQLIRDNKGRAKHFICQYLDITQRKTREQYLQLTEARYRLSQRHGQFGVWDWNIQTNDLYWSEQIGPLIGYADGETEVTYADFIAAVHPDDRDYVNEAIRAAIEDHARYDIEHRVVWPDGTVRLIRERGDVIRAPDNTPLNMIGVAQYVKDYHCGGEASKEKENITPRHLTQQTDRVGHWSWNVAGGKLNWSDNIYRLFGYQPGEIEATYDRFIAALHPDDVERVKRSQQRAFTEGKPHSINHRIIRRDGSESWVHEEALPIVDGQGRPVRLTGTMQDITERKRLEQQLADKKEQAEAARLAKSTFLSHMSHELRTPLNVILGFAQIMALEDLPDSAAQGVKEIMNSGWRLLELVDDLLDLSRLETDDIDLKMEFISIRPILEECYSIMKPLLADRQLRFIHSCEDCSNTIQTDRRRLKQVIVNLLSNAVKYNRPNGEVEVSCRRTENRLRIFVRDTGHGIPAEHMHRLFTPFDRLGKEAIEGSGTGIGLTLVKRLVDHMQGEIGVESTVGEGSRFWVEFPLFQTAKNRLMENRIPTRRQRH